MFMSKTERNARNILAALLALDAVDAADVLSDRFASVEETAASLAAGFSAVAVLDGAKARDPIAFMAAHLVADFGDMIGIAVEDAEIMLSVI